MIVIGVDVHKESLTAVAVDEAGRALAESTASAPRDLLSWASSLPGERSWAVEDCRQLTRALERALLAVGESLVRVPPKLMAPQRRAGRPRGKSDPIDALAVARAALREPRLDHPRPGEQRLRELKLLVDHRDDLIDERPPAPHGSRASAPRSTSSRLPRSWPATPASHRSKPAPANTGATGSTAAATASSTAPCTGSRSRRRASTHPLALTSSASRARGRADAKLSPASNDSSLATSSPRARTNRSLH